MQSPLFVSIGPLAAAAVLFSAGPASAQFRLFDDFDDDTLGLVDGQDGWDSSGGANSIAVDPDDLSNLVLLVPASSSRLHKMLSPMGLSVADGQIRMMFMRVRVARKQTFSVGLSFLSHPTEYSDFGPEIGMASTANDLDLRVWDGDGDMYEDLTQLLPATWYNLWVRVDSSANTAAVWLNSTPGATATPDDRLCAADGDDLFEFRAGNSANLFNFYVRTSGGDSGENQGPVFFDDIFIEITDSLNLSNPIGACTPDLNGDGVLDLSDVSDFVAAFLAGEPQADLAPMFGAHDLADVVAFVSGFLAGCP